MNIDFIEDKGMQLIKKGKKSFFKLIFSRLGLILILLIAQLVLLFNLFNWFAGMLPHLYGGVVIFNIVMVLHLLNQHLDSSAKITWFIVIMVAPVVGALLYLYTKSEWGHRIVKYRLEEIIRDTRLKVTQSEDTFEALKKENAGVAAMNHYLNRENAFPVYKNTDVTYFPSGEAKFEVMLDELKKAKDFIFLEYFIIEEGVMWGKILEILAQKVKEGVEVRVMYDGMCEFTKLSHDYPKRVNALGIQCKQFSPVVPILSTHYNYRDHRKILIIDGHTAFTGGVNLADEYINHVEHFGHWKDTAIMLKGEAVASFTLMFLQMWSIDEKNLNFDKYLQVSSEFKSITTGYVTPYADSPLDADHVGESVYMDMINRAVKSIHIMTPYLILDDKMEKAITYAAKRGVDVKLILPGIPDKKSAYALAKGHYQVLLQAGVQIFEYTPGFVHAKVCVVDRQEAVVGTINFDYRSLYHHFECAAHLFGCACIQDIEKDFTETVEKCRQVTGKDIWLGYENLRWKSKVLKALAPLM